MKAPNNLRSVVPISSFARSWTVTVRMGPFLTKASIGLTRHTLELLCLKRSPLNSHCKGLLRPDDLCALLESGREIGSDNVAVQRSGMRGKGASAPHCPLPERPQHPREIPPG